MPCIAQRSSQLEHDRFEATGVCRSGNLENSHAYSIKHVVPAAQESRPVGDTSIRSHRLPELRSVILPTRRRAAGPMDRSRTVHRFLNSVVGCHSQRRCQNA